MSHQLSLWGSLSMKLTWRLSLARCSYFFEAGSF